MEANSAAEVKDMKYFANYLKNMRQFVASNSKHRNAAVVAEQILDIVRAKDPLLEPILRQSLLKMFESHIFREDMFMSVWRSRYHNGIAGFPDILSEYIPCGSPSEAKVMRVYNNIQ